jgi:hypothetical protein
MRWNQFQEEIVMWTRKRERERERGRRWEGEGGREGGREGATGREGGASNLTRITMKSKHRQREWKKCRPQINMQNSISSKKKYTKRSSRSLTYFSLFEPALGFSWATARLRKKFPIMTNERNNLQ